MEPNQIHLIGKALSDFQREMVHPVKSEKNPYFESTYANLLSVCEAATQSKLSDFGLSYTQITGKDEKGHYVMTILIHSSGQFISGKMYLEMSKHDMQSLGSAITYARRYGLQAILGFAAEDDDGEGAVGRTTRELKYIDDKQLNYLRDGLVSTGGSEEKFCKWLGVMSLDDIPSWQYGMAKAAVDAKIKEKEKK